jgi:pyruvate kinase
MIESPMPTRAEVTDVANAVYEQADAIMLSGETTVGKHPLKCIEVFDRIARRIERSGSAQFSEAAELTQPRQKLVKSAIVMANELRAEAILVITRSGNMARYAAWLRPRILDLPPVPSNTPARTGSGRDAVRRRIRSHQPENTTSVAQMLLQQGRLHAGTTVVITDLMVGTTRSGRGADEERFVAKFLVFGFSS